MKGGRGPSGHIKVTKGKSYLNVAEAGHHGCQSQRGHRQICHQEDAGAEHQARG